MLLQMFTLVSAERHFGPVHHVYALFLLALAWANSGGGQTMWWHLTKTVGCFGCFNVPVSASLHFHVDVHTSFIWVRFHRLSSQRGTRDGICSSQLSPTTRLSAVNDVNNLFVWSMFHVTSALVPHRTDTHLFTLFIWACCIFWC